MKAGKDAVIIETLILLFICPVTVAETRTLHHDNEHKNTGPVVLADMFVCLCVCLCLPNLTKVAAIAKPLVRTNHFHFECVHVGCPAQ